jgi:hypothetical protein
MGLNIFRTITATEKYVELVSDDFTVTVPHPIGPNTKFTVNQFA